MYSLCNQVSNIPDAGSLPQSSNTQNVAPQSNLTLQPPTTSAIPPISRQSRQIPHTITSEMVKEFAQAGGTLRISNAGEIRPLQASTPQPNNGKFHSFFMQFMRNDEFIKCRKL